VIIGPSRPGFVKVAVDRSDRQFVVDAPIELLQPSLRLPNSQFVALVNYYEFTTVIGHAAGHISPGVAIQKKQSFIAQCSSRLLSL
jgi:hypothetical protein